MLLFFFNHAATAEISPLSLHDALPSCPVQPHPVGAHQPLDVLDPLLARELERQVELALEVVVRCPRHDHPARLGQLLQARSEEHTSELQSRQYLVCRLLLEKKKQK